MRSGFLPLTVFAAVALTAATSQSASAQTAAIYPWCMQPSARWGPDCAYATIKQCRAAASAVGFCHQNPAFMVATQGKPERVRR